jgi:hypothetical protein
LRDFPARRGCGPPEWGDWPQWGDQKNGTYRNPVLPGDYRDLDCIRVGSDCYANSSPFQYSPGRVVLRSKDPVTWRIIGHVVDDVSGEAGHADFDSFTYRSDLLLTR